MQFIHCFQAEWLKKKRSLASWLVVIGAFFTPVNTDNNQIDKKQYPKRN